MTILKKWQLLTLLLVNAVAFNACSNPTANNQASVNGTNQQKTEKSQKVATQSSSNVQAELDKAKKAGKAVFVIVTGTGSTDTDKALAIAKGATGIYKNSIIIQMNKDDEANAQLVTEWRLAGAPVPLILALSTKGQLTGGFILAEATSENLAALMPSPKLELVYEAIGNSKHVIVAFTKKSFADRTEVITECKKAVSMLNNEAVFIEVDMEDSKENGFMQQLRISPLMAKSSVSLVINKQGQVAGQSSTIPDATKLVAAAKAPVKQGCGPGCGPAGCGK
jgi:hypothetical protein